MFPMKLLFAFPLSFNLSRFCFHLGNKFALPIILNKLPNSNQRPGTIQ